MAKKAYRYQLHLERLPDDHQPAETPETLELTFDNHDNLFVILEKIRARQLFDEQTSAEFALGLKLLSEVVLKNRQHPLFSELKDAISTFMQKLKAGTPPGADKS